MKFSGKGPAIHSGFTGEQELVEFYNDMAADWPWPAGTEDESKPKVGQLCGSKPCQRPFVDGQMVYLAMETNTWMCWRHIHGLTGPALQEK